LLCQELRVAFDNEALSEGQEKLILTAAVGAGKWTIDAAYEIPQVSAALDFINLMSYDLNGAWNDTTNHNSPLYVREEEKLDTRLEGRQAQLNMEWAAKYWEAGGCPKEKLIIGMATYGRGFTLMDPLDYGYNASARGPSQQGKYTGEQGYISYYEICEMLNSGRAKRYWTEESQVPHIVAGDQWIGYDDEQSLRNKVDWMVANGYGGWMAWALDLDDFSGTFCGQGKYPLLTAMNDQLGVELPATTPAPPTTPGKDSEVNEMCQSLGDGTHAFPDDETYFVVCDHGQGVLFQCPEGTVFNPNTKACGFA